MENERRLNWTTPGVMIFTFTVLVLVLAVALPLTAYFASKNKQAAEVAAIEAAKPKCDLSAPWYEQYTVVTHALGAVEGRIHTNAKEAFLENYERGSRVFEADFCLTSDGELVVRHDFTGTSYYNLEQRDIGEMTYEQYKDSVICYNYTPLDVKELFGLMLQYPDTYLVTDTKVDDEETTRKIFEKFCEAMDATGDATLRERIVIQIYNYEMYDWVEGIVPEQNYIFTLYMLRNKNFTKIGEFCTEKSIPVVTLNETILKKETVDKLHGYGVEVFAHTLNRTSDMASRYVKTGVDGWYSDYVTHDQYMGAVEVELARQEAENTTETEETNAN